MQVLYNLCLKDGTFIDFHFFMCYNKITEITGGRNGKKAWNYSKLPARYSCR